MNINPFNTNGAWYKGNLHGHSTNSDGSYTAEELKEIYKANSYHFIALTEHDIYKDISYLNDDQFLMYPGIEIKSHRKVNSTCNDYRSFHLLCYPRSNQKKDNALFKNDEKFGIVSTQESDFYGETQNLINHYINEREALVTINHPVWSRLMPEDLLSIDNYFALEIYNGQCAVDGIDRGEATLYWDLLLRSGRKVWGYASDDQHNLDYLMRERKRKRISSDNNRWSSCKGWVCVYAENLSINSISDSLEKGKFYSSTGPEITHFSVEETRVFVEFSRVERVNFITYDRHGESVIGGKNGLHHAEYILHGDEKYVRIECIDSQNKIAWSNPIFLS